VAFARHYFNVVSTRGGCPHPGPSAMVVIPNDDLNVGERTSVNVHDVRPLSSERRAARSVSSSSSSSSSSRSIITAVRHDDDDDDDDDDDVDGDGGGEGEEGGIM
jgi:hypothetical protein